MDGFMLHKTRVTNYLIATFRITLVTPGFGQSRRPPGRIGRLEA